MTLPSDGTSRATRLAVRGDYSMGAKGRRRGGRRIHCSQCGSKLWIRGEHATRRAVWRRRSRWVLGLSPSRPSRAANAHVRPKYRRHYPTFDFRDRRQQQKQTKNGHVRTEVAGRMLDLIGAIVAIFNFLSTWRFTLCILLGVAGVILVASIFESLVLRLTSGITLLLVAGFAGYIWQSRFERHRRRV
jgi:hypothetical protein